MIITYSDLLLNHLNLFNRFIPAGRHNESSGIWMKRNLYDFLNEGKIRL